MSAENFNIFEDPRFKQGRKFMNEKQFEDAIDLFSSLLESCNEQYGNMSIESAQAYFEYGNALLMKEEENPSNDVLGNVSNEESNQEKGDFNDHDEDDVNNQDDEEVDDDSEENQEQEEAEGGDDPEGDLQIAWEVLDLARVILAKNEDPRYFPLLSDVYSRLGDLMRFNNNIAGSIEEYLNCLKIRSEICPAGDRLMSDIYFSLAVAHIYNSSEKNVDPSSEKKKALEYYISSKKALELWIENFNKSSNTDESSKHEVEELVDMLNETVDALKHEIKQGNLNLSTSSTTIGFGKPASTSSSNILKRPINENLAEVNNAPVIQNSTLQVKKKQKKQETEEDK